MHEIMKNKNKHTKHIPSTAPSLGENESTNFPGSVFETVCKVPIFVFFYNTICGESGGGISRKTDQGVLDRPWTK